jgi:ribosomal protein S14
MDNYKRKMVLKYEIKRIIINSLVKNKSNNLVRSEFILFIKWIGLGKSSKTKINSFCLISGRSYNVLNKYKLSRFQIRQNGYLSNISSLQKF